MRELADVMNYPYGAQLEDWAFLLIVVAAVIYLAVVAMKTRIK